MKVKKIIFTEPTWGTDRDKYGDMDCIIVAENGEGYVHVCPLPVSVAKRGNTEALQKTAKQYAYNLRNNTLEEFGDYWMLIDSNDVTEAMASALWIDER